MKKNDFCCWVYEKIGMKKKSDFYGSMVKEEN